MPAAFVLVRPIPSQSTTLRAALPGVTGDHARWVDEVDGDYRAEGEHLAPLGMGVDIAFVPIAMGTRYNATESLLPVSSPSNAFSFLRWRAHSRGSGYARGGSS